MGFEKDTNQLRNSNLNFLLHFYLLSDHFFFFFVDVLLVNIVFAMGFFLITAFQQIENFLGEGFYLIIGQKL